MPINKLKNEMSEIANAIRKRKGTTNKICCSDFDKEILDIPGMVEVVPDGYIKPQGSALFSANGEYDISEYETITINVPVPDGYIKPEGSKEITENGTHTVRAFESVTVNVNPVMPDGYVKPDGTLEITSNGTYTVTNYNNVTINVPIPDGYVYVSGSKDITSNGTHVVKSYESVKVNVPIPDGYVKTSGTKTVSSNGTHDVENYKNVYVNVSIPDDYVQVAGSQNITVNGTYDVSSNSTVTVNVPVPEGYVLPAGSKEITANGTHNVNSYETVEVNVPVPDNMMEIPTEEIIIETAGSYDVTNIAKVTVIGNLFDNIPDGHPYEALNATEMISYLKEDYVGAYVECWYMNSEDYVYGDTYVVCKNSDTGEFYYSHVNRSETIVETADADATAECIERFRTAYVNGVKVVGTFDKPSGSTTITVNGTYNIYSYESVTVDVRTMDEETILNSYYGDGV